jgi:hypothetical protein
MILVVGAEFVFGVAWVTPWRLSAYSSEDGLEVEHKLQYCHTHTDTRTHTRNKPTTEHTSEAIGAFIDFRNSLERKTQGGLTV